MRAVRAALVQRCGQTLVYIAALGAMNCRGTGTRRLSNGILADYLPRRPGSEISSRYLLVTAAYSFSPM